MELPFPAYDDYLNAAANIAVLQIFLAERDAELANELRHELEALPGYRSKNKARLLFSHFGKEWARKRDAPQAYQYRPIGSEQLVLLQKAPLSVEERAERLSAAETRIRLLEQLRENDLRELAALIQQFRAKGLTTDAETDVILAKVSAQCDTVKEENRRLRLQLDSLNIQASQQQYLLLAMDDLRLDNEELSRQVAELRLQLGQNAATLQELEQLRELNERLVTRPSEETLRDAIATNVELRLELVEKDSRLEELERALDQAQRDTAKRRATTEEFELARRLADGLERIVERQEVQLELLAEELEQQKQHFLSAQKAPVQWVDYTEVYGDQLRRDGELIDQLEARVAATDEALEQLRDAPIYALDRATGQFTATGQTLASYMDSGRAFQVLDADSLRPPTPIAKQGHVTSEAEDALRQSLLNQSAGRTGPYSVRLQFASTDAVSRVDVTIAALDPVQQQLQPLLVASGSGTHGHVSYGYANALPQRMIPKQGLLTVTLYKEGLTVAKERRYSYALVGHTGSVVRFDDGTRLYARYLSPTLYSLDVFVTPV